jgi:hypothetical protein
MCNSPSSFDSVVLFVNGRIFEAEKHNAQSGASLCHGIVKVIRLRQKHYYSQKPDLRGSLTQKLSDNKQGGP